MNSNKFLIKIVIAIIASILIGQLPFIPIIFFEIMMTFSSLFGNLLSFFIPILILALIINSISNLSSHATNLLTKSILLSWLITAFAILISASLGHLILPRILDIGKSASLNITSTISPLFTVSIKPLIGIFEASLVALFIGLPLAAMKNSNSGESLRNVMHDFYKVMMSVLKSFFVPLIPLYIFSNFSTLSYTGQIFYIINSYWKVYAVIFSVQILYALLIFFFASIYTKKSFADLIKKVLPAYLVGFGTQSSAASIPANLEASKKMGVKNEISEFVIPLAATTLTVGSTITITLCIISSLLLFNALPSTYTLIAFFILFSFIMVIIPGAPGGAIMTVLPYLTMLGIAPTSTIAQLLITLYLTQDSFGTAINVAIDNVLALLIDKD